MYCPKCNSENTQTLKMMCLSGTTTGTSTAVGVTSDLHLGAAVIGSRSQTNLAANYDPRAKPDSRKGLGVWCYFIGCFLVVIMSIEASKNQSAGMFLFGILVSIPIFIYGYILHKGDTQRANIEIWEQKNKLFETGWICHKCGNTWNP